MQESSAKKGNTEKLISKFSKIYTPCIILAAILLTFLPPLLGMGPISMWLGRALVFLVASCPCALVISIPLSFFAGIGAGSRRGVLVKGSKSLEALAKTRNAVFDKTGTLTTGKLSVTGVAPLDDSLSADELLRLSAVGESFSAHPMAQARSGTSRSGGYLHGQRLSGTARDGRCLPNRRRPVPVRRRTPAGKIRNRYVFLARTPTFTWRKTVLSSAI